jgi:anthranilate phosphoribosyltransferase
VLAGEPGPKRDVVLLNAAFALMAAGAADTVAEGLARAAQAIDSGAALAKLEQLAALTNA